MARFDTMFDNFLQKAKEIATTAGEKTSEAVEIGRLKYRQNQVANQLEKTYAKLGAIVYEARQNGEDFDNLIDKAIEDIAALNQRYDQLEEAVALVGTTQSPGEEILKEPLEDISEETEEDLGEIHCTACTTPLESIELAFDDEPNLVADELVQDDALAEVSPQDLEEIYSIDGYQPNGDGTELLDDLSPLDEAKETELDNALEEVVDPVADMQVSPPEEVVPEKKLEENKTITVEILDTEDE